MLVPGSGAALLVLMNGDAGEVGNGGPISGGIAAMKSGNGGKEASAEVLVAGFRMAWNCLEDGLSVERKVKVSLLVRC